MKKNPYINECVDPVATEIRIGIETADAEVRKLNLLRILKEPLTTEEKIFAKK